MLWLAPFAGAFVVSAARAARESAWRSLGGHVGCAVLLGLVFTTPVLPASERDEDFDERHTPLSPGADGCGTMQLSHENTMPVAGWVRQR